MYQRGTSHTGRPQFLPDSATNDLFCDAYQKLNHGDPVGALQTLLILLQALGGREAAIDTLSRTRDALLSGHSSPRDAADELSQLFADISLHRNESGRVQDSSASGHPGTGVQGSDHGTAMEGLDDDILRGEAAREGPSWATNEPILVETGREGIADAAMEDGSSVKCPHCGGVVKKEREIVHYEHWCPARPQ